MVARSNTFLCVMQWLLGINQRAVAYQLPFSCWCPLTGQLQHISGQVGMAVSIEACRCLQQQSVCWCFHHHIARQAGMFMDLATAQISR